MFSTIPCNGIPNFSFSLTWVSNIPQANPLSLSCAIYHSPDFSTGSVTKLLRVYHHDFHRYRTRAAVSVSPTCTYAIHVVMDCMIHDKCVRWILAFDLIFYDDVTLAVIRLKHWSCWAKIIFQFALTAPTGWSMSPAGTSCNIFIQRSQAQNSSNSFFCDLRLDGGRWQWCLQGQQWKDDKIRNDRDVYASG